MFDREYDDFLIKVCEGLTPADVLKNWAETLTGPAETPYGHNLIADRGLGLTLAIHGHAHNGSPAGSTPGGTQVRNVAFPVIKRSYGIFAFDPCRVPER